MPDLGVWEILIIAVVILILFGSRKMPDAARSLGRSLRILKTEVKGLHDDEDERPSADQPQAALPPGQPAGTPSATASPGSTGTAASPSPGRSDTP
jgi:sec-independent protein translocase protein TatA